MTFDELKMQESPPNCKKRECPDDAYRNHRGFCQKHYRQHLALEGRKERRGCTEPGCPNKHRASGLCVTHYNQEYKKRKDAR